MQAVQPICMNCKHLDRDPDATSFRCSAFPDGIPEKIIFNEADHRRSYRGDNGIRYDPIDPTYELPENFN